MLNVFVMHCTCKLDANID